MIKNADHIEKDDLWNLSENAQKCDFGYFFWTRPCTVREFVSNEKYRKYDLLISERNLRNYIELICSYELQYVGLPKSHLAYFSPSFEDV